MAKTGRKIVGIGETVLDIVFRNGQPEAAVPGGSVFNAMVSLGRTLGKLHPETTITMASQTGDDPVSDIILGFMRENNLDTGSIQRVHGQSTVSMALLDSDGNARYEFFRDRNLPPFLTPETVFRKDDMLLFGSFFAVSEATVTQTRELVRRAKEAGAIIYYDINFRKNHNPDPDSIEKNIALCDIVRASDEDIEALYGESSPEKVYREHISPLCQNFICTRGALPAEVFAPGIHGTFPVEGTKEIVSTVGAGDNFNAGVLYSIVHRGFSRERIYGLSQEDWGNLVHDAMMFSSEACSSLQNYVSKDFWKSLSSCS